MIFLLLHGKDWLMHQGRIVFSQLMDFFPPYEFHKCVQRYQGHRRIRSLSCLDQFRAMAYAQLTGRESLRETVLCLSAMPDALYHAGFRSEVARSTLADANEKRDWRIYARFAQVLIARARRLYGDDPFVDEINQSAYALDSTTIDLCLSLFPWARFRRRKSAVKLHTLMDLRGSIPCFIRITSGRTGDVTILDDLIFEPGSFYIMDRGYIDFARLYRLDQAGAFFVVRGKRKHAIAPRARRRVDRSSGLRSDQTVRLTGPKSSQLYPDLLRRVTFFDEQTRVRFVFFTNNFLLPASTVAQLYKARWRIELFFKWIKQNLRIKAFFGTSDNAVKTQIWIAITVYVLVAIVRKELKSERSLHEILHILGSAIFQKIPILQLLSSTKHTKEKERSHIQLDFLDL